MIRRIAAVPLVLIALLLVVAAANAQNAGRATRKKTTPRAASSTVDTRLALEPKALEILKATSMRLAAARTVSFTAVEIFEHPSRHGHPLAFATRSEVTLQRPDKLRVIISGDGPASEYYYDGKKAMAYAPAENLVAIADAAPTIDAELKQAYKNAGIYFPFTDLIVADPFKDMAPGMLLAYYIGQSHVVGGTTTDIVAYVGDGVFVQVWVGAEDKLPRMVHAVYLDDPDRLRHELELSNWQLDAAVSPDAFTSSAAANAQRMPFAHPNPEPAPAGKPAAKGKSRKPQ